MQTTFLRCISCTSPLEHIMPASMGRDSKNVNQASDGLEFTTPGAYGTSVFDPMDGTVLAITVCDSCIQALARRGLVAHVDTEGNYTLWGQDL